MQRQNDQVLHRVATKEREKTKGTTKQKAESRHSKEGGNDLEGGSIRQTAMEGVDGGLHPAVDRQSLSDEVMLVLSRTVNLVAPLTVLDPDGCGPRHNTLGICNDEEKLSEGQLVLLLFAPVNTQAWIRRLACLRKFVLRA